MTLGELLFLVAIAAALWLLLIRPSLARRRAQAALIASLAPGQEVMTTAGVFGTIVAVGQERISLEIAPGVVIEMLSLGVARIVSGGSESDAAGSAVARDEAEVVEDRLPRSDGTESDRG